MKKSVLLGGIMVAVGAASYGMLTTFVKLAGEEGFSVNEVILSEYIVGVAGLLLMERILNRRKSVKRSISKPSAKNIRNLLLAGASMGVTTFVYYFSVQYISVSIAIVLLMQSVWMGVVWDAILNKVKPDLIKILAVITVLGGTLLATNVFFSEIHLDWRGVVLGFLAALSYSITILATNRVALDLPHITRSKWMTTGALILVLIVATPFLINNFNWRILYTWGLFFGFFGGFLPPILLNYGMPRVNLGIGSILTSMELPVAVSMAYFLLNEQVNIYQWIGIILILIAIAAMNLRKTR